MARSSIRRILSTRYARMITPSQITTADAMPASWDMLRWMVQMPSSAARAATVPVILNEGLPLIVGEHLSVQPGQAVGRAQRFRQCLLRGESGGLRCHRTLGFGGGEDPPNQARPAFDRLGEPIDVADVDTDSDDHALY